MEPMYFNVCFILHVLHGLCYALIDNIFQNVDHSDK